MFEPTPRGRLQAKVKEQGVPTDPCLASSESRYRGVENQLYRVEIHDGRKKGETGKTVTFKWSRENGSVVFPIREMKQIPSDDKNKRTVVSLEHLGRDAKLGLQPGDWVEIVNDDYVLLNSAAPLLQVHSIDPDAVSVTLEGTTELPLDQSRHPLLRRWDQRGRELIPHYGVVPIDERQWQDLEDGIQIKFATLDDLKNPMQYRTGDYWLIPARVATGNIEWPQAELPEMGSDGKKELKWGPVAKLPRGIDHHYAPLAILDGNNKPIDLRHQLAQSACLP